MKKQLALFLLLLSLSSWCHPGVVYTDAPSHRAKIASEWINKKYTERWKGYKALTDERALLYAMLIEKYCALYDLDFDRELPRLSWEKSFINGIADQDLPTYKWAFGIGNIWISEAKDEAKYMGMPATFTAHDLIINPELNISLALHEMSRMIKKYGDVEKAEMIFNVGDQGYKNGVRTNYPADISAIESEWKAFEKRHR